MKKTILLTIIIILSFVDMVYAADKWDKEDIALATTFTVATIIDWGQTRDIAKRQKNKNKTTIVESYIVSQDCDGEKDIIFFDSEDSIESTEKHCRLTDITHITETTTKKSGTYYEINPFLGKRPTLSKIDKYMPLTMGTVLLASHYLPSKWRKNFLYTLTILEIGVIGNNYKIGLNVNF